MLAAPEISAAADLLEERCGLSALYVFGSQATGRARPESDVDLAALTDRLPEPMERIELREALTERLGRPVDLVFLGGASPILARQVLQHGRLVVDRDPRRRAEYTVRVLTEYADLKRARAPVERRLIERTRNVG